MFNLYWPGIGVLNPAAVGLAAIFDSHVTVLLSLNRGF
jgi:hypothetical protein